MTARIAFAPKVMSFLAQKISAVGLRTDKRLYFATRDVPEPVIMTVPTRHGPVRCRVHRPHPSAPLVTESNSRLPVHLQIHGGAFFIRVPQQDDHINSYIASEVGAVVINPDYRVAPQVQYPTAEEQCYDVATWVQGNAWRYGWDGSRVSVGGTSAGGKLAFNIVQMVHAAGDRPLRALVAICAVADATRTDRTSPKPDALIDTRAQKLMLNSYFADTVKRTERLASPAFDPDLAAALPPTLILTGGLDTLGPEMDTLAERLMAEGAQVDHRRFPAADHGFSHFPPVETARKSIQLVGRFLLRHLR
ncbi:carboxylesterase [Lentzea pudingi]|uniref:Carboxylesterase n=1 Tax=Lentzea pudingi TaxID=1789439 RepID=A0ABQ2I0F7_9PSEU|nr:alpha/beta hydrolase [Lentzea pudingi]GGM94556.1 carboxylesterase [Lentzea pudingi]